MIEQNCSDWLLLAIEGGIQHNEACLIWITYAKHINNGIKLFWWMIQKPMQEHDGKMVDILITNKFL